MDNRSKRIWLTGATLTVGLGIATWGGMASACTAFAKVSAVSPSSGNPGQRVTVVGEQWASVPVTIHWGSETGPVLATTTPVAGHFDVAVTIPSDASATTAVVATTATNGTTYHASNAFTVVDTRPADGPAAQPASNFALVTPAADPASASGPSSNPSPVANPSPAAGLAPGLATLPGTGTNTGFPAPATGPEQAPAQGRMPPVGGPVAQSRVDTNSAELPAVSESAPAAGTDQAPAADSPTRARSLARTATGDVWAGFGSLSPTTGAGLASPSNAQSESPALAVGLLMTGAMALVGLASALVTARRRARA